MLPAGFPPTNRAAFTVVPASTTNRAGVDVRPGRRVAAVERITHFGRIFFRIQRNPGLAALPDDACRDLDIVAKREGIDPTGKQAGGSGY